MLTKQRGEVYSEQGVLCVVKQGRDAGGYVMSTDKRSEVYPQLAVFELAKIRVFMEIR